MVQRVAPSATAGEAGAVQGTATVYCRITDPTPDLKPLMSGHARIACGRRSLGRVYDEGLLRYVRTEFWW